MYRAAATKSTANSTTLRTMLCGPVPTRRRFVSSSASTVADRYYVMEKGAVVLEGSDAAADENKIKNYLAF